MKYTLTVILSLFFLMVYSKELNYLPKPLQKELVKKWGLVNSELIEISDLSNQLVKEGKFFKPKSSNQIGFVFVGRVYSCRAGGCDNSNSEIENSVFEYFDAYIIYDKNKVVQSVRVFNYQASHGHEITSKGWLKQFIGYNGQKTYEVGKDIDSISGATISVHAITDEINYITELLKHF